VKFTFRLPAPLARARGLVREIVGRFFRTDCSTRAAGLTLFSVLAIVPILCCVLVLAKVCGVDRLAREQIDARIDEAIAQVEHGRGEGLEWMNPFVGNDSERKRLATEEFAREARAFSNNLFARIERFDIGALGWIGFGFLLWTIVSSLSVVEESLNRIWGVMRPRSLGRRIVLYLFILVVLPVLATLVLSLPILGAVKAVIVATMGATAWTRWASDGLVLALDSWFFRTGVTLFMTSLVFGFLYWILPNHPVRFLRAWLGGAVAAVLLGGWMKVCAIAQVGIAKSSALYGGFALLPIVLAWLHVSWQIILFAACLTRTRDVVK